VAKGYVEFHDTSREVMKELRKLSGRALRAGGKVAAQAIATNTPKKTGKLAKAVGYRVKSDKDGTPYLELGFFSKGKAKQKGRAYFANPNWIEFGTKPHTVEAGIRRKAPTGKKALSNGSILFGRRRTSSQAPQPFVKNAVMANIKDIRKAQEVGLALLSKRVEELAGIPNDFEIEDGESP